MINVNLKCILFVVLTCLASSGVSAVDLNVSLLNSSYVLAFETLDEHQMLLESSSIKVITRDFLRIEPESFNIVIKEGQTLSDVLDVLVPDVVDNVWPLQLIVVVVKKDSIDKMYIRKVKEPIYPQLRKDIILNATDVVILSTRS